MLKRILLALIIVILAFVGMVAMQPSKLHIERSTTIATSPALVFEQINSLQQFQTWSPWANLDPNAKYSFEGSEAGTGATMKWSGNDEVGEGSLTIVESDPAQGIKQKLIFTRPFASQCDVALSLQAIGDQETQVTWSMDGTNDFMGKAIGLFMDMDQMVGSMYEKGLTSLKEKLEKSTP